MLLFHIHRWTLWDRPPPLTWFSQVAESFILWCQRNMVRGNIFREGPTKGLKNNTTLSTETTFTMYQQCNSLDTRRTRTTTDRPSRWGSTGNWGMREQEKQSSPGKSTAIGYTRPNGHPWKPNLHVTLQRQSRTYSAFCVCTYTHVIAIHDQKKRRGHEIGKEQGQIYKKVGGRRWRWKWCNCVILSKLKEMIKKISKLDSSETQRQIKTENV